MGIIIVPGFVAAHPGNGIIALSENAVVTGDAVQNGIWRFEKGKPPAKLTGKTPFHCHWMTKGLGGQLYAETLTERGGQWTNTIYRFDSQGEGFTEIARKSGGAFGVFGVGESGQVIYQVRSEIMSWSGGKSAPFRGSGKVAPGSPALGTVRTYAWGPDGSLFLADGPHVRRIGADGVVRNVATVNGQVTDLLYAARNGGAQVWGLTVDKRSRVFAAVPSNNQVIRIDLDGSRHVVSRGADGWQATGVAVFNDTLFLLESRTQGNTNEGPRVRAIRRDGKIELLGAAVA